MTLSLGQLALIYFGYTVLSSIANAMSATDRSLYGFTLRFLRLMTNSAVPLLEKELHIKLPTQDDAGEIQASSSQTK